MTTPETDIETQEIAGTEEQEERKRRWLLLLALLLLLLLCGVGYLFVRYLNKPQPLPDLLPPPVARTIHYPPSYRLTISGVDNPVGIALSPDEQRIYVAESGGERLVKIFDRNGALLGSFAPPGTDFANRDPKYLAVDSSGRVFLVDRTSNSIHIFDRDGNPLDAIVAPDLTLSEFLAANIPGGIPEGLTYHFEGINRILYYTLPGATEPKSLHVPEPQSDWAPMGIRFDKQGNLIYTDITPGRHSVRIIPAADLNGSMSKFNPQITFFGEQGSDAGQLNFPQIAVSDGAGNYYVSDGNNYRVTRWDSNHEYLAFFGFGSNEASLNLPRGMWMDSKDRLHIADAVGSLVRVYDVSGESPVFLFNFGGFGIAENEFSYPMDIVVDSTGRLFIADRANNRVQVWSY